MADAIVFDDLTDGADGLNELSPLADLRSVYAVRTGALTTLERIKGVLALREVAVEPRGSLRDVDAMRDLASAARGEGPALLINGRCVLPPAEIGVLEPGEVLTEGLGGAVIAARVGAADVERVRLGRVEGLRVRVLEEQVLMSRPWHVRTFRDRALAIDLALLGADARCPAQRPAHCTVFGDGALRVHPSARIYPGATFDLEHGDVLLDEGAVVRPGCILVGPVYVGPHTVIRDQALIKPQTAFGPECRMSGEVGGTIVQGHSNKAHDGHLGDSWLGQWVNLGAGTTNSNLLNTYGQVPVRVRPATDRPAEPSGEQFLGALCGDHVKTAICTRIMTGAVLHTGVMFAASRPAAGCLGPFQWITDAGAQPFRLSKFLEVAAAVMDRRHQALSEPARQRLEQLHRRSTATAVA